MAIEDGVELTPELKKREQEILINFSHLLETERSRYEAQAIKLIELKKLETETAGFKLSYIVKEKSYLCQLRNHDKAGNSYEIEFPIPDSDTEKLETLIELFAQSEAGRLSK
jgi:hypothetical protein